MFAFSLISACHGIQVGFFLGLLSIPMARLCGLAVEAGRSITNGPLPGSACQDGRLSCCPVCFDKSYMTHRYDMQ